MSVPAIPDINPSDWFSNPAASLEIEIGSGKGTFLVEESSKTKSNLLGIEWAKEYWRYSIDRVSRRKLRNVRVLLGDAVEFLKYWCQNEVVEVIHIYFSDPWPKPRHHKRRVVQDKTLKTFYRVLVPGGRVHIVTDHEELWRSNLYHIGLNKDLFSKGIFVPENIRGEGELIGTNFERKYRREGRPFYSTTLTKIL